MRAKLQRGLALLLVACLMIGYMPSRLLANNNIVYLKNSYTQGAYLYEEGGILRYGIPTKEDTSYQWQLLEEDGHKIIKNVKTGHYITLLGHSTKDVEGYFGEPVSCREYEKGNDSFYWDVSEGEGQNILSASRTYQGFGLHMENVINGEVRSQFLEADQLEWGNMKWDTIKLLDMKFQFATDDGVCIQNVSNGKYLYVEDGFVLYGTPSGEDDSYIWLLEQDKETTFLKNKLTGEYINLSKEAGKEVIKCSPYKEDTKTFGWKVKLSTAITIQPVSKEYDGYGICVSDKAEGNLEYKELKTIEKLDVEKAKWNVVAASEVGDVAGAFRLREGVYNLKNSYYSLYMMEENNQVVYGNGNPSEKKTQWRIIFSEKENKTALINEETGHYFYIDEETGELKPSGEEVYYWNLLRNKNTLYPDAVLFQDSLHEDRYLHMESLNGYIENTNGVQPSWGTPHWRPIPVDASHIEIKEDVMVPENFVRIESAKLKGSYLYENNAGALIYGEYKKEDGRSHWRFIKDENSGAYLIKNRETEHIILSNGNGILRVVEQEQTVPEGALWIMEGNNEAILLRNVIAELADYVQPYMNLQKQNGSVQSSLISIEDNLAKFKLEEAPEKGEDVITEEELAVSLDSYLDSNLYELSPLEGVIEGVYQKECYKDHYYFVKAGTKKYLYYKDGWKLQENGSKEVIFKEDTSGEEASGEEASLQWSDISSQGDTMFLNGKQKVIAYKVKADAVYGLESSFLTKESQSFTVFAKEKGDYLCKIERTGAKEKVSIAVNGITVTEEELPSKKPLQLSLNKGINTITFGQVLDITSIVIQDSINKEDRGASLTSLEYQAEDLVSTGTVLEEDRTYHEIQSEASKRSAVVLDGTGQYIKLELKESANSIVLRYSIPDSSDGAGLNASLNLYIDGQKNKEIALTSKYSWSYGTYPWSNIPADGAPHHYFDEVRVKLDKTYPAGTVLKLQKDASCTASYYVIDFIELDEVDEPNEMPANALSISDFGATANDESDDTKAFLDCLKEAVKQQKEVWIPAGEYRIDSPTKDYDAGDKSDKNRGIVLAQDNVVIRGSGMWHSTLSGEYAAFFIKANNISFYDFSLRGNATARRDAIDPSAIETDYNTADMSNLVIQNIWIEHYKTGIWTHNLNNMHVVGCRIRNTYADGMNLRRGTSNSVVEQCDVRNTGDDAIAQWSSDFSDTNNKIRYNTVGLQWLANNIALYGGTDIEITNNLLKDTVTNGAGINISTNFNPKPFAGTILIANNTLLRCGSEDHNTEQAYGAIWFNTVDGNDNHATVILRNNKVMDSTCQGVSFSNNGTVSNVTMEMNYVDGCGMAGIEIGKTSKGSLLLKNNVIKNMLLERIVNGTGEHFKITEENIKPEQVVNSRETNRLQKGITVAAICIVSIGGVLVGIYSVRGGKAKKRRSRK